MKIIEAIIAAIVAFLFGPRTDAEVEALLVEAARGVPEATDWRNSIVDLLKILHRDSNIHARMTLARNLAYPGVIDGSAEMNMWLHRAVMEQVRRRIIQP